MNVKTATEIDRIKRRLQQAGASFGVNFDQKCTANKPWRGWFYCDGNYIYSYARTELQAWRGLEVES